jgi:hypothetical protein
MISERIWCTCFGEFEIVAAIARTFEQVKLVRREGKIDDFERACADCVSTQFLRSYHVMAGQHGYQTKHIRLVAFLVLVCLTAGLVRRVPLSPRSSSEPRSNWSTHRGLVQPNLNPDPPSPRLDRIHGRWEAVRASLGLPPLSHEVVCTPGPDSALTGRPDKRASRFDLGRKRRDEAARQLPWLHFAPNTRPAQPDDAETVATAL